MNGNMKIMSEDHILEINNLVKYYGKFKALNKVNINVKSGTVHGFLGPNGAGKTTTIRIIFNILKPTSGEVKLFGIPINRKTVYLHERIGYIPGDVSLYGHLNVKQMLEYFASLRPNRPSDRMEEIVEKFDLDLTKSTKTLSKGNRQKVAIVQAFMHDPDFYIFDEPSSGLDPLMQQLLYDTIINEAKKGKTFFISSHILPEIQKVSETISIIRKGEIVSTVDVSKLEEQIVHKIFINFSNEIDPSVLEDDKIKVLAKEGKKVSLLVSGNYSKLLGQLSTMPIEDIHAPVPSLEDYFMHFYSTDE
ncbi:MAG: ABC transporter ATP-binding protein [Candidatus Hodarchaeota archaeon]